MASSASSTRGREKVEQTVEVARVGHISGRHVCRDGVGVVLPGVMQRKKARRVFGRRAVGKTLPVHEMRAAGPEHVALRSSKLE